MATTKWALDPTHSEIGFKVKNQLRIVPSFEFYIDDSLDYAERIEELLKK